MMTWPDVNGKPRSPPVESAAFDGVEEPEFGELPGSPGRGAPVDPAPVLEGLVELVALDVVDRKLPGSPPVSSAVLDDAEELRFEELPGSPGRGASVAPAPVSEELVELVVLDAGDEELPLDEVWVGGEGEGEGEDTEVVEEVCIEEIVEEVLVVVRPRTEICDEVCDEESVDELLVVVSPREDVVVEEEVVDELVEVVVGLSTAEDEVEEKLRNEVVELLVEEKVVDEVVDVVEGLATASRKYFKLLTSQ
jgi:hypothetical protein